MKNKNSHKHLSIHQRIEAFCHHRAVLTCILAIMGLAFIKYQVHLTGMIQKAYAEGFGLVSVYTYHHDEVNRMPVEHGVVLKLASHSGQ